MSKQKNQLLTFSQIKDNDGFPHFKNDRERIKYMSNAYKNMSIAKSFNIFYNLNFDQEFINNYNKSYGNTETITIGNVYIGKVIEFKKNLLTFAVNGVKEEIICKDNFNSCMNEVEVYLMNNDNKLLFEVREKKNNKYYVSVINAYYRLWETNINKYIKSNRPISVHIDSLVKGGYLCHMPIDTLNELTGKNYTHLAFIPGSQIVLNIEHDFEKWIGQDVDIIPQNFVDYYRNFRTGEVQKSLVGSRKKLLNNIGMKNMENLYSLWQLSSSDKGNGEMPEYNGIVTGVINSKENTGVFIEIEGQYITGLLPIDSTDLLDYKAGDIVHIKIDKFTLQEGLEPFIYNKYGNIVKSNVKVIFKL